MNPCGLEMLGHGIPVFRADDVQMIDRPAGISLVRKRHARGGQQLVVPSGSLTTLSIPCVELPKLDSEHSGLNCVKATVIAFEIMIVLADLAVVTKHPDLLR